MEKLVNVKMDKLRELQSKAIPEYIRQLKRRQLMRQEKNRAKKRIPLMDKEEIAQWKLNKTITIQQRITMFDFKGTEKQTLDRVYKLFDPKGQSIGWQDIKRVMTRYGVVPKKEQAKLMIWRADLDQDGKLCYQEFKNMYLRCIINENTLQPYQLFYLTQFLMYCQPDHITVSVEDALQLIYVRAKDVAMHHPQLDDKTLLHEEVRTIFGAEESEERIGLAQFMERMKQKDYRLALQRKTIIPSYI